MKKLPLVKFPVVNAFKPGVLSIQGEDDVAAIFNGENFVDAVSGEYILGEPGYFNGFKTGADILQHEDVLADLTNASIKDVVVIYHGGCPDGVASAIVAVEALGDDLNLVPGHYAHPLSEENIDLQGKTVVLCDFSYPLEEMQKIVSQAYRVIFLDHHRTPLENLAQLLAEPNVFAFASVHYSGASLTWQFFNPGKDIPLFISYIEDGDLYKFILDDSRNIVKGIHAVLDKGIRQNSHLLMDSIFQQQRPFLKMLGEKINEEANRQAKSIIKQGRMTATAYGHTFPVINATPDHTNLVGELIYTTEDVPFVMIYTILANRVKISLRSNANAVDVAELAQRIFPKGGGHRSAAAGFMPFDQFHKEVLSNAVAYVAPVAEEKATCTCEHH